MNHCLNWTEDHLRLTKEEILAIRAGAPVDMDKVMRVARVPYPAKYYRVSIDCGITGEWMDPPAHINVVLAHPGRAVPYLENPYAP